MKKSPNDVIVDWFVPLLVGPFIGSSSFATLKAILHVFHGGLVLWVFYVLFALPLAFMQVIIFAGVDIALLRAKLRALPTGLVAWQMAIASPVIVGFVAGIFPKPQPQPEPALFGIIIMLLALVPMTVVSIAMRLLFGKTPDA